MIGASMSDCRNWSMPTLPKVRNKIWWFESQPTFRWYGGVAENVAPGVRDPRRPQRYIERYSMLNPTMKGIVSTI